MTDGARHEHLLQLALAFVRQEEFLASDADREARLANIGSDDEGLWSEVVGEFVSCTATSDELLVLILENHDFTSLDYFGQAYVQPWVEKASLTRLEWLAELVRTDERARRALTGVRKPPEEKRESTLWALMPPRPVWPA
jgi:hypothetical protein